MTEPGRCRACRWWVLWDTWGCPVRWGTCLRMRATHGQPDAPDTLAFVPNYKGSADLVTAPDFGCTEFSPCASEPVCAGQVGDARKRHGA